MANVYSVMAPDEVNQFSGSLKDLAITMGADTKYSATEAAQGIEELLKAGVSVTDIMNGGLKGALSLAAAGELSLGDAAEIASTALNAFKNDNLSVQQAADILAGAANASATSVSELKFGLSSVSAVASSVGWSFKDTTTALALFAQSGLKGQDAGTSLKTMLMNLQPTTDKARDAMKQLGIITADGSNKFVDAQGHFKSLAEISDVLQSSMSGLTDAQRMQYMQTMFGSDAIRAANILFKEGAKGANDMATAMGKVGADDVAAKKMDTLKGALEQLNGAFETAKISIGNALIPVVKVVAGALQSLVDGFNKMSPSMQSFIAIAGLVAAAVLLIAGPILMLIGFLPAIMTGFSLLAGPIGIAMLALTAFGAIAAVVIAKWTTVSTFFSNLWTGIKNIFTGFWNWLQSFFAEWGTVILAIIAPFIGIPLLIYQNWSTITAALSTIWTGILTTATTIFMGIATFFSTIWTTIQTVFITAITTIASFITTNFSGVIVGIQTIFSGLATFFTGIWEAIKTIFLGAILIILDLVTLNFTQLSADAQLIWNNLKDAFSAIWEGIKAIFTGAVQIIATVLSAAWNGMKAVVTTVWNGIKSFLSSLWSGLVSLASSAFNSMKSAISSIVNGTIATIQSIWNGILNFFRSLPGTLASLGSAMFNAMKNAISSVLSTLGGVVRNGFSSAISYIKSLPSQFLQWGKDMIQGLINGIRSMIGGIGDAIGDVAEKIRSMIHFSRPDEGPLRDYERWMPDFMQGLAKGINKNKKLVGSAIESLGSDIDVGVNTNISDLAAKLRGTVDFESYKASSSARSAASYKTVNSNSTVTTNNKGVTQNINFNQPVETPSETARAVKRAGRDLAYGL
jgi:TP901 family phage tail tape measure protein